MARQDDLINAVAKVLANRADFLADNAGARIMRRTLAHDLSVVFAVGNPSFNVEAFIRNSKTEGLLP